jgi:hypothetical protein
MLSVLTDRGQHFAVLADGALVEGPRGGALAVDDAAGDGQPVHPPELDPVVAEPLQVRGGLERPLHHQHHQIMDARLYVTACPHTRPCCDRQTTKGMNAQLMTTCLQLEGQGGRLAGAVELHRPDVVRPRRDDHRHRAS